MGGPAYYGATMNIARNEDWVVAFVYGTQNDDGSITPINLAGSTIMLEIRQREAANEAIISVDSNGNGITITNAAAGTFTIMIARALMTWLVPGEYTADLIRAMPSGWRERIFEGTAVVVEGTTR